MRTSSYLISIIVVVLLSGCGTTKKPGSQSRLWSLRSWMSSSPLLDRRCDKKCDCEEEKEDVQLMAIEKEVKVPKIKIHDFGKKEDWELYNKIDGLDISNRYAGMKYVMKTSGGSSSGYGSGMDGEPAESGWEVAGKYDFETSNWDMNGLPSPAIE